MLQGGGTAAESGGISDFACPMSLAAVGVAATKLKQGSSRQALGAALGTAALGVACTKMVAAFTDEPQKPVTINILTPSGSQYRTVSGSELAGPSISRPTTPRPYRTISELIACGYWKAPILQQMCYDGEIDPPRN